MIKEKIKNPSKSFIATTFILLFVVIALSVIIAITSRETVIICESTKTNAELNYTIKIKSIIRSKDSLANTIETTYDITTNDELELTELKDNYRKQYEENNKNYGGYNYRVEDIDKTHAKFIGTTKYDEVDFKKYAETNPSINQYITEGRLSLEGAKRQQESSGAICKAQ